MISLIKLLALECRPKIGTFLGHKIYAHYFIGQHACPVSSQIPELPHQPNHPRLHRLHISLRIKRPITLDGRFPTRLKIRKIKKTAV